LGKIHDAYGAQSPSIVESAYDLRVAFEWTFFKVADQAVHNHVTDDHPLPYPVYPLSLGELQQRKGFIFFSL
jgi:hypothetical protein